MTGDYVFVHTDDIRYTFGPGLFECYWDERNYPDHWPLMPVTSDAVNGLGEFKPAEQSADAVNHPHHYTSHASGIEAITITEHMSFCIGNVFKYCWRAGEKGEALEDLRKAAWYLAREIDRIERLNSTSVTNLGETA